ncbi:MAG: GH1 family beta-glucosidase [Kiritimatiellales bacterium]
MSPDSFPEKFLWGCATASYQVEGAANEDGRGKSIWDTFSHTPGNVKNNDTGDISVDQYHRYKEDIAIMKDIGIQAYRFSVSWPRVMPAGRRAVNQKGLDYYHRLIDALLDAGIQPWMTLFHWDLPQALQDDFGGWKSVETTDCFADYATLIAEQYADKVNGFFTVNELFSYTDQGYDACVFPPGIKVGRKIRNQIRHHALLGHGKAVLALRAVTGNKVPVGIAENPKIYVPIIETQEHIEASRCAMRIENSHFITAVLEEQYTPEYLIREGADAPDFTAEEMQIIGTPLDFIGINAYYPTYVRAASNALGYEIIPVPEKYPVMGKPWIKFGPQIIYWSARHLKEIWDIENLYITENGCAATDQITPDGKVLDVDRILYLREHFRSAKRAIDEGYPIKGYFVWSLIDNFEWADGYDTRFGIVYADYKTLKRTPKLSAGFLKKTISNNHLV